MLKNYAIGLVGVQFPVHRQNNEFNCKVFQHDCPIFYHIEYISEKYGKEDYETDVEI
ncbi:hypothetical protein LCGC14_1096040 [marine sediment metagenome]|uniref:Uncharacterized protein n=1 Tax=marine sediment metagenome TaxID=412755 RepID=A0A0F9QGW9_9ZZZZ